MAKQPSGVKEFFRKRLVALKRKPQMIPLIALGIAFIFYSLNLTHVADTTALINGPQMGLAEFVTMLFSVLSLVCCMNAFPYRKKVNIPMLILMILLVCVVLYCDYYYGSRIVAATTREENRISMEGNNSFIAQAKTMLNIHMIMLVISLALTALLPVYSKLLRKINTSINIEENGSMSSIDLSAEDA